MAQIYGGDEVNAVVLDPGSAWTRVGWASDDAPSETLSSWYAQKTNAESTRQFGDDAVNLVRSSVEVLNPYEDGLIKDWDAGLDLWRHALGGSFSTLSESPLLVTAPTWAPEDYQAKVMEFLLEDLGTCAAYIAKSPVCSLFSSGRGSGLVVDAGAQTISMTPIVDGLVLNRSSRRSHNSGDFLSASVKAFLADSGHSVVPRYKVVSKEAVQVGAPAKFVERSIVTSVTYDQFQQDRVVEEIKESIIQVHSTPLEPSSDTPSRVFEFPDGFSMDIGRPRFEIGEKLFNTTLDGNTAATNDLVAQELKASGFEDNVGASDLLVDSIKSCDVDIRANLANGIVVCGGTSLVQGFTSRINGDLEKQFPGFKIRLFAPGNVNERRSSAWIGASILASLGTFHQLWVSKKEWDEAGASHIIQKRFK